VSAIETDIYIIVYLRKTYPDLGTSYWTYYASILLISPLHLLHRLASGQSKKNVVLLKY